MKFVLILLGCRLDQMTDGVWKAEVEALMRMLNFFGWSYREVGPDEIKLGILGEGTPLHSAHSYL